MKNNVCYYDVGALLYCPANSKTILNSIVENKFDKPFSLALCLEDTIKDECVDTAIEIMISTLKSLYDLSKSHEFYIPKIFIRVRNSAQLIEIFEKLSDSKNIIEGFIAPKFSLVNADSYIDAIFEINKNQEMPFYLMPIFEDVQIVNLQGRYDFLYTIKEKLRKIEPFVKNIRVGGNDLCHIFGLRRNKTESIHDLKVISSIFTDILTVFGADYVVSGCVWEYYSGYGWDTGLLRELKEDRKNGFIGKTIIHPNQISLINKAYKVTKTDYEDALSILNWDENNNNLVSGSWHEERMNEYKTHFNWAQKILYLAQIYGIEK